MSKYFFYCPHCHFEFEKVMDKLPKDVIPNLRDGYGLPIYHFECEQCHNLDSGFMRERIGDDDEKSYYREVIKMYQGIRGFNKQGVE